MLLITACSVLLKGTYATSSFQLIPNVTLLTAGWR